MGDAIADDDAHTDFEAFTAKVVAAHDGLPKQLRKIAGFVLDNPQRAALMTIADMSAEIGVQPSAVIRFSKALGFAGFSDVQKILRQKLQTMIPSSYKARLEAQEGEAGQLRRVVGLAQASLEALPKEEEIMAAARMLDRARVIHVVGMRRAFGTASYAAYMLGQFGAAVHQITASGAMVEGAVQLIGPEDAMLGISYPNYRPETLEMVEAAARVKCPVIAMTDSALSPIAKLADHVLLADQGMDAGFRSVAGAMVTVQALAMAYGSLQE